MNRRTLIALVILVIVGFVTVSSTLFSVHQTEQALVLQFGEPRRVVSSPGLNAKIPFIQDVKRLDKRILSFDAGAEEIIASDQKRMVVDAFARYRIVDPLLYYQKVNNDVRARLQLGATVNSRVRQVLGGVPLQSLLTEERVQLMRSITNSVDQETRAIGVEVVDVRIKRADLPAENSKAIYDRMKAEREREAKEFRAQGAEAAAGIRARAERDRTVLLAEAQRDSQVIRGTGDGVRNKIFADAYGQDPDFFGFYRAMLAYQQALGEAGTTMVLSPDSDFFRYFNDYEGALFKGRPPPRTPSR
ncbi:MAG: protease modulator HflC [Alphaproteobacteria bacterium]|nr:protease modulator HflC [Alphaproteobacteria bacterium]